MPQGGDGGGAGRNDRGKMRYPSPRQSTPTPTTTLAHNLQESSKSMTTFFDSTANPRRG